MWTLTGTDGYLEPDAAPTEFGEGTALPFHPWANP